MLKWNDPIINPILRHGHNVWLFMHTHLMTSSDLYTLYADVKYESSVSSVDGIDITVEEINDCFSQTGVYVVK